MNLGKLLGTGKTFFGGNKGAAAYREKKGVYLPNFNSAKNPFMPRPAEPAPAMNAPAAEKTSAPLAARVNAVAQKLASPPAVRPVRPASWTSKLNPFRAPAPVAPPMVNGVQPELSLDAVKVIHNDLADADIEIVPVKSRTVAAAEMPDLPTARQPWEFLGERLIKA
ncbi:MAG TPA: hypothetical protein VGI63_09120 [Verrucomicrobiae bacterium]|jgi:hypothetical protein